MSAGTASWVFRYERDGRGRYIGLGSCSIIGLAVAREKGRALREQLLDGIDPLEQKRKRRQQTALDTAKTTSFREVAETYIAAHESSWTNPVHRRQWRQSLADHVYPAIGGLPVAAIDTALVVKVLSPLWTVRRESASRIRGRIESILDAAKARGLRDGENPARWRGHLENLLPKRAKGDRPHHAAMAYADVPAFLAKLRQEDSIAARALEFTILCAARSGETTGAVWEGEINLIDKIWTISGTRMKGRRAHRVPLSARCVEILASLPNRKGLIFGGARGERLTKHSMPRLLERMGHGDVTVHGFRSSFRDWAGEQTSFPREIAEQALAHTVGEVERAYRRGDALEKRRALMQAWSDFLGKPTPAGADVIPIGTRHA
jgi:integrase